MTLAFVVAARPLPGGAQLEAGTSTRGWTPSGRGRAEGGAGSSVGGAARIEPVGASGVRGLGELRLRRIRRRPWAAAALRRPAGAPGAGRRRRPDPGRRPDRPAAAGPPVTVARPGRPSRPVRRPSGRRRRRARARRQPAHGSAALVAVWSWWPRSASCCTGPGQRAPLLPDRRPGRRREGRPRRPASSGSRAWSSPGRCTVRRDVGRFRHRRGDRRTWPCDTGAPSAAVQIGSPVVLDGHCAQRCLLRHDPIVVKHAESYKAAHPDRLTGADAGASGERQRPGRRQR